MTTQGKALLHAKRTLLIEEASTAAAGLLLLLLLLLFSPIAILGKARYDRNPAS